VPAKETGMKKAIAYILSAVITILLATSCSAGLDPVGDLEDTGYTIVVSGSVADIATAEPLENVKITFYAAEVADFESGTLIVKTVYTDNRGRFNFKESGFEKMISCRITAEDHEGTYTPSTQKLFVSWTGPSFDNRTGTFFVNDLNFHLEKK